MKYLFSIIAVFLVYNINAQSPGSCNIVSLPDSLYACIDNVDTLYATVTGSDSIIGIHWSPTTGLSDTSALDPTLTVSTAGWYYLTVESRTSDNLVVNGDFSAGDSGFSTAYTLEYPSITSIPGDYAVATNPYPYDYHYPWPSMGDHTTGTGNMLIVDGAASSSESFWCQTISVAPYTQYVFSVWTALLVSPVPEIKVTINGDSVSTFTTPADSASWQQYQVTWNSGTDTTATICMYDLNTVAEGNDFVVDDISLTQICVAKDSIYLAITFPDTTYVKKDTTACVSASGIALTAPSGYTHYLWNNGNTGMTLNITESGIYWITARTACSLLVDTFHVVFKPLPLINLGRDTSICRGDSLLLISAQPAGSTYLWNTGSKDSSITVSSGGIYDLQVTNNDCTSKDSIKITEVFPPVLNLSPDTILCFGQQLILLTNPDPSYTYTWSENNNSFFAVTQAGSYWVSAANTCGVASDTIKVAFDLCDIWFPSAFTPNGDGRNDIFRAVGDLTAFSDYSLSIYNRWGQRIFYTKDIYAGWNGEFNGVKQDIDTYFYMAYYSLGNKTHMLKGDLQLIR